MVPDTLCKEYLRCWIHRPVIGFMLVMLFYLFLYVVWCSVDLYCMPGLFLCIGLLCLFASI